MNVIFRVDSSLSIGTGHIIRCLNIAKQLKVVGGECLFITKTHNGNIIDKISEENFSIREILSEDKNDVYIEDEKNWLGGNQINDAKIFCKFICDDCIVPDIIIVDHYSLDTKWEKYVKEKFPSCILVVIDDLCNRSHFCDFIIDQTFGRQLADYNAFNPNEAKLLMGTQYALLHPQFRKLRAESLIRKQNNKKKKNILLTLGGIDNNNTTGKIIDFLNESASDFINEIDIVIGSRYAFKEKLQKEILDSKYKIRIHQNTNNMPELMMGSDLAIGALGGTTWERCVMGLPAVNICIANNQKTIAKKLSAAGMIVLDAKFLDSQSLLASLRTLNDNYERQKELAKNICDGNGLLRIIQKLVLIQAKDRVNIELSPATEDDTEFVYQLQCLPETRRYARNPNVPSWDEHQVWMKKKIGDCNSFFYIINHKSRCGVLRLDPVQNENIDYEISIFLSNKYFGKGIASAAIKRALFLHNLKTIVATVLPENVASNKLFEHVGFTRVSEDQFINKVS